MIISIDSEKFFDRIKKKKKTFQQIGFSGNIPENSKGHIWQSTTDIIFNAEKQKTFPLKSGVRQRCALLPLSFSVLLEFLDTAVIKAKETTWIQIGKKEVKLSLFAGDMILYIYLKINLLNGRK